MKIALYAKQMYIIPMDPWNNHQLSPIISNTDTAITNNG